MDGNGRWATNHNLPRFQGHVEGVKRVQEIVHAAVAKGIEVLTLFAFSTENWRRPPGEVSMLMQIMSMTLEQKVKELVKDNVRLQFIGRREGVPADVLDRFERAINQTRDCSGMILNLAFNYGSRCEIIDAVRAIARQVQVGELSADAIDEGVFQRHLYTSGQPDPDLLIRTSGEQRISNFLLWQLSYAELYFTETLWPEFHTQAFEQALTDYQNRERRYGKVHQGSVR